ncbi:MAG: cytochrome-c oxidase [SAR86 cluster bacterium]|uniref:Cytochrome-c oxidase n=1 Tax=SAR86 cluster bacterium TaxID=2030880 RepID=A0A2A4MVZ7_9GAMM|nr:MAG: cytochrome-c oxidase [SAR86 cluster bacterium]
MSLASDLAAKPWESKGIIDQEHPEGAFGMPPEKVALWFFLIVASIIFSLFMVSYVVRMELPDWVPLDEPSQLWINTAVLILSSVLFQWSRNSIENGKTKNALIGFTAAGVFAFAFIVAQYMTWLGLRADGFYLYTNPADAFYYLITAVHAIHLLGGLWVWCKSAIKLARGASIQELSLSIELCTMYWHFLLIVWLIIFAVLANT